MEKIKTEIRFNDPIKILVPKQIYDKVSEYIIEWENRCIPGLIEFLFQDDTFGYEIKKAIIKFVSLENSEIDKIFHLVYADDNKIDIIFEIYKYYGNNLTIILMNENGPKIITDTRSIMELNDAMDWIYNQTNKFNKFLDDILSISK